MLKIKNNKNKQKTKQMTIENIISHSIHISHINDKELISIIHTEKGNTDRCFNTIIFNFREEENHKIKINFDYNRRFDLKPEYYAEPFYNPNMTPLTREERAAALKYISKELQN